MEEKETEDAWPLSRLFIPRHFQGLEPSKGGWDTGAFQQEEEERGGPGELPALSTLVRQPQKEGWREGGLPRPTLIITRLYSLLLPFVPSLFTLQKLQGQRNLAAHSQYNWAWFRVCTILSPAAEGVSQRDCTLAA